MSRPMKDRLMSAALAFFVSAPMCYILQMSLGLAFPVWYAVLLSAAAIVLLEVVGYNRSTAIIIPAALAAVCLLVWWGLEREQRLEVLGFFNWAFYFVFHNTEYTRTQGVLLDGIFALLVTLVVWLFGRKFFFFPAVFVFVVAVTVLKWLSGLYAVLEPGAVACGGLMLLWVRSFVLKKGAKGAERRHTATGIAFFLSPLAALLVLLSLVLVPEEAARSWQSRQVYDLFERFNNYLADYTGYTRPTSAFSIGRFGFMPMGTRLGGPVELSDDEVLEVGAPEAMLLRGIVYNNYTGSGWTDTTESRRIRFNGSAREAIEDAFDQNRPALDGRDKEAFERYVREATLTFHPLVNSPATLFAPFRGVTAVKSDKFLAVLPYFNAKGELFSASDVRAGYNYRVTARYLDAAAEGFDELMLELTALGLEDPVTQTTRIRQNYIPLPDAIEDEVYELTESIVDGLENDYEKAVAIREHLMKSGRYTLSPSVPPEDRDFVSYFLNSDRNGYCTYFASAMAVMARIADIPSRYAEGYLMPSKPNNGSWFVLTGENAHAWAELYFEGIGWIPFDATPTGSGAATEGSSGPGGQMVIPTAPPTFDNTPTEDGFTAGPDRLTWKDVSAYLWTLPAAAVAAALAWVVAMMIRAKVRMSPAWVGKRFEARERQCAWYYQDILKLLEYYNYPVKRGETPYAFAARIDRWLRLPCGTFMKAAGIIALLSYSDHRAADEDVAYLRLFRNDLARYTYRTVGALYYLRHKVLGFRRRAASPART